VSELPPSLTEYLLDVFLEERHPAYLEVDKAGQLLTCGGALAHHAMGTIQVGASVEERLPFLLGLLPCPEPRMALSSVQTEEGRCIDVHILQGAQSGSSWVVLFDSRSEHQQKQAMQQKGNELSLRSQKQSRVLSTHLGKSVAQLLMEETWPIRSSGERREATILFSDLRDFTPFSERSTPEEVFATINQYIPAMLDPIQAHSGIVDKIAGDAVMAVFGILGTMESAPQLAVDTAIEILRNVAKLNAQRASQGQVCLEAGIGIATGPVAVGLIGTRERRGFSAIGHHVNFASRLQGQARPTEILVDEDTHRLLSKDLKHFGERTLTLKGIAAPVRVFSLFPLTRSE
jgi:class 3 adenylate cyclase